jgi:hypothetical protein
VREGLLDSRLLISEGRQLSEETIIALKKLERDYLVAQLGLKGTLTGACGCLIVIVLIIVSPMFIARNLVGGWQVVAIVVSMVVSVVLYGAFIFERSLTMSTKVESGGLSLSADTMPALPPTGSP